MIVIVSARMDIEAELKARQILTYGQEALSPNEVRLQVSEEDRAKVRDWFAHNDDVLWFSRPPEGTESAARPDLRR